MSSHAGLPTPHEFGVPPHAQEHMPETPAPPPTDEENGDVPLLTTLPTWTPMPLKLWFGIMYTVMLICLAIALEVVHFYNHKHNGWATSGRFSSSDGIMHYVYTYPPAFLAMSLAGLWTWTDTEVKRLQASAPLPYVDLIHGDSPADHSLLLDYTRTLDSDGSNLIVWIKAILKKHYLVALTSLMTIMTLVFQPSATALLVLRDTWMHTNIAVTNLQEIGLNQNQQFQDLTTFLGASGFASSKILYGLGDAAFVRDGYTVGEFHLPLDIASEGTVFATTTAILSDTGCRRPDQSVQMSQHTDGNGWTNSVTFSGCAYSWTVDKSSQHLFGAQVMAPCSAFNTTVEFMPVIFWFFTYEPTAMASVTMCAPSITLHNVAVTVDLSTSNLTSVQKLSNVVPVDGTSTQHAGNLTGAPINGQAYNGLSWPQSQLVADPFVNLRAQAIQLQLPAAVFQNAVQSQEGLAAAFINNIFTELSATVYRSYLTMLAKLVYLVDTNDHINVRVQSIEKRLWLSKTATHLLAAAMLVVAIFGGLIQYLHCRGRERLRLLHCPGTLASATTMTASTPMAQLLDGRQYGPHIEATLQGMTFGIDSATMKVVVAGGSAAQP
ncbi:hypothetical protein HETIRDRAFT_446730 [Heterobasidion irregulare TC 32-1]|uniref:Uncharacterized protein n=1 Tax=Heterobasidion irregulare (strain TC 32-1) TaxID=747525 RepID=W4JQY9_HETIT|nr:uncharacterized protein HETIRDRAFT_446730 [Heterobasidion irregulare TC 32-1]ETW75879.1 hypothetical protein HETIRDRAFT_446730 [Heterobasidion irregulare TC 32-1]